MGCQTSLEADAYYIHVWTSIIKDRSKNIYLEDSERTYSNSWGSTSDENGFALQFINHTFILDYLQGCWPRIAGPIPTSARSKWGQWKPHYCRSMEVEIARPFWCLLIKLEEAHDLLASCPKWWHRCFFEGSSNYGNSVLVRNHALACLQIWCMVFSTYPSWTLHMIDSCRIQMN